jgi:hypothetical protein
MKTKSFWGLLVLLCFASVACATEDPAVAPSPTGSAPATPGEEGTPDTDPLVLSEGTTANGMDYRLVVVPGDPVCVQLRRMDEVGDFMLCDEDSEQDFNGDDRLRYAFGGLNPEQVPKFIIGITAEDVARVVINLPDGESPAVTTEESSEAPGRRFFVVMLNPEPAQEIQAIRGLDSAGKTVAGFSLGEPDGDGPSPLPTG